ncbi:hypothetical protein AAHE18_09G131100 [Arachis hypogaea]
MPLCVAKTVHAQGMSVGLCLARRCFERVLNGFSLKGSENPNLHHAAIYLTVATLRAQARNQFCSPCCSKLWLCCCFVSCGFFAYAVSQPSHPTLAHQRNLNLWPKAIVLIITPPPIDEVARLQYPYTDNPQGVPERTNEAAGEYARACTAVAAECGVPVIDLWTKMQQCPDWKKEYLSFK